MPTKETGRRGGSSDPSFVLFEFEKFSNCVIILPVGEYIMNKTSLSNFLNNVEAFINNAISNEQITMIKSSDGNLVLISEKDFLEILNSKDEFKIN